jgi:hypothetical protein
LPTAVEAAALNVARRYLRRVGTHAATHLLGFPPLTKYAVDVAEFSNMLLTSAAVCEGVLDLANEYGRK